MPLPVGEDERSVQRRYLWFGNLNHQQWVPMPSAGIEANRVGTVHGEQALANGGYSLVNSKGFHREFEFSFGLREARTVTGLDVFSKFRSGYWDDFDALYAGPTKKLDKNLIYFVDPFAAGVNALPPHWATPALSLPRDSWHAIGTPFGVAATSANTRGFARYTPTYQITQAANALPADERRRTTALLIPETHNLRIGWNGVATGTGRLIVKASRRDTGALDTITIAPLAVNSTSGLSASVVSGATYAWVQIGFGRTSSAASTVAVAGMVAQILPNWVTADVNTGGLHPEGLGHTGLEFADDAIVETYELADENRILKGLSTRLVETGAWK